jgi:lipoprotein NlpI
MGLFLAALLLARPAYADARSDFKSCFAAWNAKQWDKVLETCDRAIKSNQLSKEDVVAALTTRCGAYNELGQHDDALRDCSRAIELDFTHPSAFSNRGNAYAGKGDYKQAVTDYDEALRLDPGYPSALRNRALAYYRQQNYDGAIEDYSAVLRLQPNDADAYYNRGVNYGAKGDYAAAIRDYDEALRLHDNHPAALGNRGYAHFFQGNFATAADDLRRAAAAKPTDPYPAIWLYLAHRRASGDADAATAELAASAKRISADQWPGIVIKYLLGRAPRDAVTAATRDSDPKRQRELECEAGFFVGEYVLLAGDVEQAKTLFRSAVETGVTTFVEYTGAQAELRRLGQ